MKKASGAMASIDPSARQHVDVWIVPLDGIAAPAEHLTRCLSAEERARCERLQDPLTRRRLSLARAALRRVLGTVLGRDAAGLIIVRGEHGKPRLDGVTGVEFSLSHSRDLALIAVAPVRVGVDVEHDRSLHRFASTARRILHADSVALLQQAHDRDRPSLFLDAWTLREAHVKAVGGGLFHTPDVLPFTPDIPVDGTPVLLRERDTGSAWTAARLLPAPGARAAIVAEGIITAFRIRGTDASRLLLEESP